MVDSAVMDYRLGLIGQNLRHSVSPTIHREALGEFGFQGDYHLYSVPALPEGDNILKDIMGNLKMGEIHGVNVTIPYKQTVIPYIDRLTEVAKDIQAVNTIYLKDGLLWGDNTDVEGFMKDLARHGIKFRRAIIFGAGGAARAAVYGLVKYGCYVVVCSRRVEQSQKLVDDMSLLGDAFINQLEVIEYSRKGLLPAIKDCDLIVNAAPCGMYPNVESTIWIEGLPFPSKALVYDMVYNPQETVLTRLAKSHNLTAVSGLGMLVYQAMLAFYRWTGKMPSYDRLYEAAKAQLKAMVPQKENG